MSPTGTTMVGAQPLEALPEAPRRETDKVGEIRCGFVGRHGGVCQLQPHGNSHHYDGVGWFDSNQNGATLSELVRDWHPRRMSDGDVARWRADMIASLAMWREPDGFLLPTETEPEERERIRERLTTGIEVLNRVLGSAP